MNTLVRQRNRPIELLEEALQVLRSAAAPILLQYWAGSLPFAIALLLLLHDGGVSWGSSLLLRDSLCCAVAFIWLSYWKSRTSSSIFSLLAPGSNMPVSPVRRTSLQAIFQTLKLFVMPFAASSILAWPVASAFFRSLALEPLSDESPLRGGFQRAFASATQRYAENTIAYLTIVAFSLIIWFNVLITIVIIPSLWKTFTGYETDWSRMDGATVAGLFGVSAVAAWLLIDPWIQTYCLLRVFYQNARSDGRDLLRDIARLAAVVVICAIGFATPVRATQADSQQALNQAIKRASQSDDYGWLRPPKSAAQNGFLNEMAQQVSDGFSTAGKRIKRWYRSFMYWIRDLLGDNDVPVGEKAPGQPHKQQLRWTLAILALLICGGIVALFIRRPKTAAVKANAQLAPVAAADVLNEQLLPSDVTQEEWLRLALEYLANNQTRLSARAFYLANLSYLGTRNLLSLSLSKSNKLYERELARQPKSGELSAAFSACNRLYERAWYGMRELGSDQMDAIRGAVDQLRQHA